MSLLCPFNETSTRQCFPIRSCLLFAWFPQVVRFGSREGSARPRCRVVPKWLAIAAAVHLVPLSRNLSRIFAFLPRPVRKGRKSIHSLLRAFDCNYWSTRNERSMDGVQTCLYWVLSPLAIPPVVDQSEEVDWSTEDLDLSPFVNNLSLRLIAAVLLQPYRMTFLVHILLHLMVINPLSSTTLAGLKPKLLLQLIYHHLLLSR